MRPGLVQRFLFCTAVVMLLGASGFVSAQSIPRPQASFRVLAFYTDKGEPDHIDFARQALSFFADLARKDDFEFQSTTRWESLNSENLKNFQVILWLNDFAQTAEQRKAFEAYMNGGGAWLGFHVSGYNDESTHWPWFVDFLGGAASSSGDAGSGRPRAPGDAPPVRHFRVSRE